jgi:PAS domain S-box-containing protein
VTRRALAVDEPRDLEALLAMERRRLELFSELTSALTGARTLAEVTRTIFARGLAVFGAEAGALCLVAPEAPGTLEIVDQFGYPEPLVEAWRRIPLSLRAPVPDAVRHGSPVWVGSRGEALERFPDWAPAVLSGRDQAWAGLPLVVDGRVLGALGLTWFAERTFDPHDQRSFTSVANLCAQSIDRCQAIDAARRHAAELEAVLAAVPVAVFMTRDPAAARVEGNQAAQDLFGLPAAAGAGLDAPTGAPSASIKVSDRFGAPVRPEDLPIQVAARQGLATRDLELNIVLEDGERRHVLASARPVIDASGVRHGAVAAFFDITERARSEQALRESESSLRGILDAARESIWLFSVDGVALAANVTAIARLGGPTHEEVIGRSLTELLPAELARSRLLRLQEVAQTGRPVEFEDTRAGIRFEHTFYPVYRADGRVGRVAVFSRDITSHRRN